MRIPILSAVAPLTIALFGCTSDREKVSCEAAVSYLSHELANAGEEEFVFGSFDDEIHLYVSSSSEPDGVEFAKFLREPWFDLKGSSV